MSKNPEALRIIARQMNNAETFRTDELGIEAACLRDAADEIERLRESEAKLREALEKIAQHDMQAIAIDALHPGERIRSTEEKKKG